MQAIQINLPLLIMHILKLLIKHFNILIILSKLRNNFPTMIHIKVITSTSKQNILKHMLLQILIPHQLIRTILQNKIMYLLIPLEIPKHLFLILYQLFLHILSWIMTHHVIHQIIHPVMKYYPLKISGVFK